MVEDRHAVLQEEDKSLSAEMIDTIADLSIAEEVGLCDIEEQLKELHKKTLTWVADTSLIWDRIPSRASDFLRDVDEVREINEVFGKLNSSNGDDKHNELLHFAQSILQRAMARLENEFGELLARCHQPLEPDNMCFHFTGDYSMENLSSSSFDEKLVTDAASAPSNDAVRESDNIAIDSIQHGLISDIVSIAKLMFLSNYGKECCQTFIMIRKDALGESLSILQMEKVNIEEVFNMQWDVLSSTVRKWNQAMRIFIRRCVAWERHLCDLVFKELSASIRESCFLGISKSSVLHLLNIAMGVAISPPKPEKLFQILNTYETLNDLIVDIEQLFSEDYGASIPTECHEVLRRLKESANRTLDDFKYRIQSSNSSNAFPGGGVHPLTKYVMNHISALSAYGKTLDLILDDQHVIYQFSPSEDGGGQSSLNQSPVSWHLKTVAKILEANLDCKVQLYNDDSLKNIFMMNNANYMVEKVRDSDLRNIFGDEWIRAHMGKFQMHARNYEKTSWCSVISFLSEKGIHRPNSSVPSITALKDKFRSFNNAFEEVYKAQTAWIVPNVGLRDDLRIALSAHLTQAYRTFAGRYAGHLDGEKYREKYIKYTPEDLQELLLDLFEGSPKSLPSQQRR